MNSPDASNGVSDKQNWFPVVIQQISILPSEVRHGGHDKDGATFIMPKRMNTAEAHHVVVVDNDIDPSNVDEVI